MILEFENDQLSMVELLFYGDDVYLDEIFCELVDHFTRRYGEPSKATEGSFEGSEMLPAFQSKVYRWDASTEEGRTTLQICIMWGDNISDHVSLGVGVLPSGRTLIDETRQEAHIVQVICQEFASFGMHYSAQQVENAMALASARYEPPVRGAIRALAETEEQISAVAAKARYLPELEGLYPQAREVLSELSGRYKLGVIANQPPGAQESLRRHGIHHFFSVFALSGDVGISKPDVRLFHLALEEAKCLPEHAAYIGDRLDNDVYPAKALGLRTVRVIHGYSRFQMPRTEAYVPHHTVQALAELTDIF